MKKIFRLYNRANSSYFDLIEGNAETKQTKGLGLLLSKSSLALNAFLMLLKKRNNNVFVPEIKTIDQMIVDCELKSPSNESRIDILIRLYANKKPIVAYVIEAKSAKVSTSVDIASCQLKAYVDNGSFDELTKFQEKLYGITLTKYAKYTHNHDFISITWMDIIEIFKGILSSKKYDNSDQLLNDYFKFITNINEGMKFYEKEVLSIPAREGTLRAINDCRVYECPNEGKYQIQQQPLFLTFRRSGGGEMTELYKIDDIIILDFKEDYDIFMSDDRYTEKMKNRINKYIEIAGVPHGEKQVFFLSETTIPLVNKPKPARNNSFRAYYELADLFNKKIL